MVEQATVNRFVTGSSPVRGAKLENLAQKCLSSLTLRVGKEISWIFTLNYLSFIHKYNSIRNPIRKTHFVREAILDVMELGEPDASGRRRPVVTGNTETMTVHLAIMALGNSPNPIVKDAEPELKTTRWGTIEVDTQSKRTSIQNVDSGGDAARGGSTAIKAAGDGQNAAHEIIGGVPYKRNEVRERVGKALAYTEQA